MKELVTFIAQSLVDDPDQVRVTAVKSERSVSYEVKVAPGEMGKIIGRGGRVIYSIRSLVKAASAKTGERAYVDVMD